MHYSPNMTSVMQSGILDCAKRICVSNANTIAMQNRWLDIQTGPRQDTAVRFAPQGFEEFSLTHFPEVANKLNLIKIRQPLFEILFRQHALACCNNAYGFDAVDEIHVAWALADPLRLQEYATIMGMSVEFAQQELSMISHSINADRFRVFALCNLWREKINACTSQEQCDALREPLLKSFWETGVPDV